VGKADSISIPQLTYLLTDRYKDPVYKTRAIFAWVAHNIAYDCEAFHAAAKRKCEPKDVFQRRKSVCEGYANLFMEMCSAANVQCLTISGYARIGGNMEEDKPDAPNHAWNAVRINNQWKIIDVTWASGYTDKKVKQFTPKFSDTYLFPDPNKFLLNHYPALDAWKPANAKLSKAVFFSNPVVLSACFQYDISSFYPGKGALKAKPGEAVSFSFVTPNTDQVQQIFVTIGEDKKKQTLSPAFTHTDKTITFSIAYDKAGSYPLVIFVNDLAALEYQLTIE